MAEAVIFIGLPGSGKTTYFEAHFSATHAHISRDLSSSQREEEQKAAECLAGSRSFVVDDTNVTRAVRSKWIAAAKRAGFRTIAYVFDTPVRIAIGRNNHRQDKKPIPVPAILKMSKQMERPSADEGFDEIHGVAMPSAPP